MEDEPRGFVGGPLGQGKQRGRGEDWLAAQLVRRGHTVVQQYPVWKHNEVGRYYIDVAIGRIAVELYSYWQPPWENPKLKNRTRHLLKDRWRVLYVWIATGQTPTSGIIDAVLQFVVDVETRSQHGYRAIDEKGELLKIGWLDESDDLVMSEPDEEPEWPDDDWTPEPPVPPAEVPDDAMQWGSPEAGSRTLAENNDIRRLWFEYDLAFDAWEAERERRKRPWEKLEEVQRVRKHWR